jgi:hypothetical protein
MVLNFPYMNYLFGFSTSCKQKMFVTKLCKNLGRYIVMHTFESIPESIVQNL